MTTPEEAERATIGAGAVVEKAQLAGFETMLARRGLQAVPVTEVSGLNYSNGDRVTLVISRIEAVSP
jgi:hypothetical protein